MIYNKKTIALLIKQNIEVLSKKIEKLQNSINPNNLEWPDELTHLCKWKLKNISTLYVQGYITEAEYLGYHDSRDFTLIPEIKI